MRGETGTSAFTSDGMRAEILNPFVHKLELDNTYDKIKTAIFTVILLPFRVIVICFLIVSAWMLACIGLYGLSEEDLRRKPMTGWRRALKPVICVIGKMSYLAGGMAITVRGRQAKRSEAPILVVAPHSSFLDSCIVYATGMSSVIVRRESMDNYVGKLINYTQPVYLWRDDPNSRQNTIKEIIARATSKEDWPQVLIFPEGTCTNRSCLITFKPGGFYPGVPVQPVTIRYPNSLDTVTWTWEGPGALKLLWLTLTQVHSSCEIEFLPVYYPNEEERRDPKLYARNVRDVMAKALGVPVLEYTYEDCRLISRGKRLSAPAASSLPELAHLKGQYSLPDPWSARRVVSGTCPWASREDLATRLSIPQAAADKIYQIFVQPSSGLVYLPDYLISAALLELIAEPPCQLLKYAFEVLDPSGSGVLPLDVAVSAAQRAGGARVVAAVEAMGQADITYDEFIEYARKRPELSFLFQSESPQPKPKSQ